MLLICLVFCVVFLVGSVLLICLVFCVVFLVGSLLFGRKITASALNLFSEPLPNLYYSPIKKFENIFIFDARCLNHRIPIERDRFLEC